MALFGTNGFGGASKKPTKRKVQKGYMPERGVHAKAVESPDYSVDLPSAEGSAFIADWARKMKQATFVMD